MSDVAKDTLAAHGSGVEAGDPVDEPEPADLREAADLERAVEAEEVAELSEAIELVHLAEETAVDAQHYLDAVTEVAAGSSPDTAVPMLLLAVSQVLLAGARLGAINDVVPSERFEPDAGPDPDVDPVRVGLANLLDGLDEYADVVDPLTSGEVVEGSLSDDLADVAADLAHGMRHYRVGQVDEALWWWQFSYLSTWGLRASSALRVLQSLIGHLRLDADPETVAEAEFDALHVE